MRQATGHAYNKFGPYFIDITATQFNVPYRVFVFHHTEIEEVREEYTCVWSENDTGLWTKNMVLKQFDGWAGQEHPILWYEYIPI